MSTKTPKPLGTDAAAAALVGASTSLALSAKSINDSVKNLSKTFIATTEALDMLVDRVDAADMAGAGGPAKAAKIPKQPAGDTNALVGASASMALSAKSIGDSVQSLSKVFSTTTKSFSMAGAAGHGLVPQNQARLRPTGGGWLTGGPTAPILATAPRGAVRHLKKVVGDKERETVEADIQKQNSSVIKHLMDAGKFTEAAATQQVDAIMKEAKDEHIRTGRHNTIFLDKLTSLGHGNDDLVRALGDIKERIGTGRPGEGGMHYTQRNALNLQTHTDAEEEKRIQKQAARAARDARMPAGLKKLLDKMESRAPIKAFHDNLDSLMQSVVKGMAHDAGEQEQILNKMVKEFKNMPIEDVVSRLHGLIDVNSKNGGTQIKMVQKVVDQIKQLRKDGRVNELKVAEEDRERKGIVSRVVDGGKEMWKNFIEGIMNAFNFMKLFLFSFLMGLNNTWNKIFGKGKISKFFKALAALLFFGAIKLLTAGVAMLGVKLWAAISLLGAKMLLGLKAIALATAGGRLGGVLPGGMGRGRRRNRRPRPMATRTRTPRPRTGPGARTVAPAATGGGGALSRAGSIAGRAAVPLAVGLTAVNMYGTITDEDATSSEKVEAVGEGVGGLAGGLAGAKLGATLGLAGGPAGAFLGGLVGGSIGYFAGAAVGGAATRAVTSSDDTKAQINSDVNVNITPSPGAAGQAAAALVPVAQSTRGQSTQSNNVINQTNASTAVVNNSNHMSNMGSALQADALAHTG